MNQEIKELEQKLQEAKAKENKRIMDSMNDAQFVRLNSGELGFVRKMPRQGAVFLSLRDAFDSRGYHRLQQITDFSELALISDEEALKQIKAYLGQIIVGDINRRSY